MSGHSPCICSGTWKEKRKNWRIVHRNHNHSYFESPKGDFHYSDYSLVVCIAKGCYGCFRSKAKYINNLPDIKEGEC